MTSCPGCGSPLSDPAQRCPSCGAAVPGAIAPNPQATVWTVVASAGPLVLVESQAEYAVYDQLHSYGRWPRSEDGYRLAYETYGAYSQSLAHGVAYAGTGYQDPARLGLPSDPVLKSQTYSAPLSFVGSTRRIAAWASKLATRSPVYAVLGWTLAIIAMLSAWSFILWWYIVIFGLFGIFVIPYRLVRRSSRKNLHVQRTALASQQAMLVQQQAMMQQAAQQPPYRTPSPPQAPPAPPSLPSSNPPGQPPA